MTTSFKRAKAAGFTLIELLIVVIILAIISAIAIPQFSSATADAQQSAADANVAAVRNAIQLYRAQHQGNTYPGVNASSGGTGCTAGKQGTGAENVAQALKDQLQYPSNKLGQTCTVANEEFRYGPYLREGIPADPFTESAEIAMQDDGTPLVADGTAGWAYDTKSGQFILNSQEKATDSGSNTPVTP